jgi:hypothetical protein
MIELFEKEIRMQNIQSSKGNQNKWLRDDIWYKADYTGYEGLTEYVVSHLLKKSTLKEEEYQLYKTEKIKYKYVEYLGCKTNNFLKENWQIITLERLFQNRYGESLYKSLFKISNVEDRVKFLVEQIEIITGLRDFGKYLCKLITIDALFLNEDRHMHNIAVLMNSVGTYQFCPVFDNGAALLADVKLDYPLNVDTVELIKTVRAKTFCENFDEQLDAVEKLYGQEVKFYFSENDIQALLEKEELYDKNEKERILEVLMYQRGKYQYLFCD